MKNENIMCKEFISTSVKGGICNVYRELSLPLYPNRYEIEMFCKTENHRKCPIRSSSAPDSLVCA